MKMPSTTSRSVCPLLSTFFTYLHNPRPHKPSTDPNSPSSLLPTPHQSSTTRNNPKNSLPTLDSSQQHSTAATESQHSFQHQCRYLRTQTHTHRCVQPQTYTRTHICCAFYWPNTTGTSAANAVYHYFCRHADVLVFYFGWLLRIPGLHYIFYVPGMPAFCNWLARILPRWPLERARLSRLRTEALLESPLSPALP